MSAVKSFRPIALLLVPACLAVGLLVAWSPGRGATAAATQEATVSNRDHLSPIAWSSRQWEASCADVRTSYNPDRSEHV